MVRLVLVFIACVLGTSVAAQSLPERYMVTGVAGGDVLNIRAEPSASSEKIGELGPFTLNVEVLRRDGNWGYIGAGERSGWVSMRYLAPNPAPANELPRPLACYGTEPFWDISFFPRGAEYNELALGERRDLTVLEEHVSDNGYLVRTQEGPTLNRTLVINALPCSDGMSDRDFGMSAILFTEAPDGNYVQNGCCTLQVN